MKWWGWGREDVAFSHEDKPGLAPFIGEHLGVDVSQTPVPRRRSRSSASMSRS